MDMFSILLAHCEGVHRSLVAYLHEKTEMRGLDIAMLVWTNWGTSGRLASGQE